jgi:hypothetical protein
MKIDKYDFGEIVIDGKKYTRDVILLKDKVKSNWWRTRSHFLSIEDIEDALREIPDILIIGQGDPGLMEVGDDVKEFCKTNHIKLSIMPTREAVHEFNACSQQGKNVVAALHLTC